jgi:hypothetical protein
MDPDGRSVAGAGVLVAPRRVVTCAHVVAAALGLLDVPPTSPPRGTVSIDFPQQHLDPRAPGPRRAQVAAGGWFPGNAAGDLALLDVLGEEPTPPPAPLRLTGEPTRRKIMVRGHPAGLESGVWARARLVGPGGERPDWIQLDALTVTGKRIQRGFSGAGVWDEENEAVIGCVVAVDRAEQDRVAWMIPVELIVERWPELRGTLLRGPAPERSRAPRRDLSLMSLPDRQRLARLLYALPGMSDPASRDLFVDYIESAFGARLRVDRREDGIQDTLAIVDACLEHPGALHELVERLRKFHRGGLDDQLMDQIASLAETADPAPLLTVAERNNLYRRLDPLVPRAAADVVLACLQQAAPVAPAGVTREPALGADPVDPFDLPSVVASLESASSVTGQLPPLVAFLEELSRRFPDETVTELRDWIDAFAGREGGRVQLNRLRLSAPPSGADQDRVTYYLLAEVIADGADASRYLSRMTLLRGEGRDELPRGQVLHDGSEPRILTDLPALLESVLASVWEVPPPGIDQLMIEFLLPFGMLGLAVDQWEVAADVVPHPVGMDYLVVVRCQDRPPPAFPYWEAKSTLLREGRGRARWVHPDNAEDAGSRLYADLVSGEALCLALLRPPVLANALGKDAVSIGLTAGLPVLVWCRDHDVAAPFAGRVRDFLDQHGIRGLPDYVRELRRDCVRVADPLGAHITLVWDPEGERVRPVNRFQAPV